MRGFDLIVTILFPLEEILMKSKISTPSYSLIPHPDLKLLKKTLLKHIPVQLCITESKLNLFYNI